MKTSTKLALLCLACAGNCVLAAITDGYGYIVLGAFLGMILFGIAWAFIEARGN